MLGCRSHAATGKEKLQEKDVDEKSCHRGVGGIVLLYFLLDDIQQWNKSNKIVGGGKWHDDSYENDVDQR